MSFSFFATMFSETKVINNYHIILSKSNSSFIKNCVSKINILFFADTVLFTASCRMMMMYPRPCFKHLPSILPSLSSSEPFLPLLLQRSERELLLLLVKMYLLVSQNASWCDETFCPEWSAIIEPFHLFHAIFLPCRTF